MAIGAAAETSSTIAPASAAAGAPIAADISAMTPASAGQAGEDRGWVVQGGGRVVVDRADRAGRAESGGFHPMHGNGPGPRMGGGHGPGGGGPRGRH